MNAGAIRHGKAWGQYVAIAGAYAACYDVALHLSSSHWLLTAGLRLACLLLVPPRFWPALVVGEFLPLFENALLCMDRFGGAWAFAASIPTIALYMAWIRPLRRHWGTWDKAGQPRLRLIVTATLLCALSNAVRDTVAVEAILATSGGQWGADVSLPIAFSAYLLGAYLGALTLTPAILAIHQRLLAQPPSLRAAWHSVLARDLAWALPLLAILLWIARDTAGGMQQAARLAMLLPVMAMACRHGWHGTAVAGLAASIALAVSSHVVRDPAVIQCQVVLAIALSAGMLWTREPWRAAVRLPTTMG